MFGTFYKMGNVIEANKHGGLTVVEEFSMVSLQKCSRLADKRTARG